LEDHAKPSLGSDGYHEDRDELLVVDGVFHEVRDALHVEHDVPHEEHDILLHEPDDVLYELHDEFHDPVFRDLCDELG
jgi:hypothetical protein